MISGANVPFQKALVKISSMSSLLRDDGVPVPRNDEGTLLDIGAVEEEGRIVGKAGVEMVSYILLYTVVLLPVL